MLRLPSMKGEIAPLAYAIVAPLLILSQHALVALAYRLGGYPLDYDAEFWLFPLRRLATLPELSSVAAAFAFTIGLAIAWGLAVLSFMRASRARRGFGLAALSVVPVLQIPIVVLLAIMPSSASDGVREDDRRADISHMIQGVLAGVAIIVFAVLVSAVTFGAYGWGLFVLTPFTVGMTTAYIANRRAPLGFGSSLALSMAAATLGSFALVMFALEGLICILLAAPLAALLVVVGAGTGHSLAAAGHRRGKPFLTVALLPAAFALEAAMPPTLSLATHEAILIDAPPSAVWRVLTSDAPMTLPPGMVGHAGLAYPISGRLLGEGVGTERLGHFSTGTARERVSEWVPARRLAFTVLSQPPAMEEMSPYRRVHAPHVNGYFDTSETRFDLEPVPGGRTRLTATASHILRIDPVLYWEPIARWAARENMLRVLRDVRNRAEEDIGFSPRVIDVRVSGSWLRPVPTTIVRSSGRSAASGRNG